MTFSADATTRVVVSVSPNDSGGSSGQPRPFSPIVPLIIIAVGVALAALAHATNWTPIIPVAKLIFIGTVITGLTVGAALLLRRADTAVTSTVLIGTGLLLAAALHVRDSGFVGYVMRCFFDTFGVFAPMIPVTMVACGAMLICGIPSGRVVAAIGMGGASCLLILCALYHAGAIGQLIAGICHRYFGQLTATVEEVLLGIVVFGMSGLALDDIQYAYLWAAEGAEWPTLPKIRMSRFRMPMKRGTRPDTPAYFPTARIVSTEVHDLIDDADFIESGAPPKVEYLLPSPTMLERSTDAPDAGDDRSADLERAFAQYDVAVAVKGAIVGPSVTQYRVEPARGVKIAKLEALDEDLARCLSAQSVRIAPIPGTFFVGVELPNRHRADIRLGDMLDAMPTADVLAVAVGKDIAGKTIVASLRDMPHLLVAGATGSGKSVCLNSMISTLLMRATPDQLRFLMVDPKRTELTPYDGVPHLLRPVITDAQLAASALFEITQEMDARSELFAKAKVKKIDEYNTKCSKAKLPYIVVVIDELADLMHAAKKTVEPTIIRLAQLGRAAGIHLIVATQRPDKNTVTGPIKANIESRMAFSVSDKTNARIILDANGAEALLGNGDMLAVLPKAAQPQRIQGAFVSSEEVEQIVRHWAPEEVSAEESAPVEEALPPEEPQNALACDKQTEEVARYVFAAGMASKKQIMAQFGLGHPAVTRIINDLHELGIVGPAQGTKPRTLLVQDAVELEEALRGQVVAHV